MAKLVDESTVLKWIWFSLAFPPASRVAESVLALFSGRIDRVYDADETDYANIPECKAEHIKALCNKDLTKAKEILAYCSNYKVGILTPDHEQYPNNLRTISCPPSVLYVRGQLPDWNTHLCISVVGTRSMTEYGQRITYLLGHGLGKGGAIVVSGMAEGIDGMAHRGCIDGGGKTVAVLGCGVDRCYPKKHEQLMADILHSGAVISEFPPFTAPLGKNFPIRNRIISGLSAATVVTEANEISGALITAKAAIVQGRDLYAFPGKLGEENSKGVNQLLLQGAFVATEALDVLTAYKDIYPSIDLRKVPVTTAPSKEYLSPIKRRSQNPKKSDKEFDSLHLNIEKVTLPPREVLSSKPKMTDPPAPQPKPKKPLPSLTQAESSVYEKLQEENGMTPDELVTTDLTMRDILTALTTLEIKGLVQALPGGSYKKVL